MVARAALTKGQETIACNELNPCLEPSSFKSSTPKKEISDECEDCEEQSECVDCIVRRVRKEHSDVTEPLGGSFEME